jgi:hypothetical protein
MSHDEEKSVLIFTNNMGLVDDALNAAGFHACDGCGTYFPPSDLISQDTDGSQLCEECNAAQIEQDRDALLDALASMMPYALAEYNRRYPGEAEGPYTAREVADAKGLLEKFGRNCESL